MISNSVSGQTPRSYVTNDTDARVFMSICTDVEGT